jgi:hypothetical protein
MSGRDAKIDADASSSHPSSKGLALLERVGKDIYRATKGVVVTNLGGDTHPGKELVGSLVLVSSGKQGSIVEGLASGAQGIGPETDRGGLGPVMSGM